MNYLIDIFKNDHTSHYSIWNDSKAPVQMETMCKPFIIEKKVTTVRITILENFTRFSGDVAEKSKALFFTKYEKLL